MTRTRQTHRSEPEPPAGEPSRWFDPSWLLLVAGLALLGAVVLIPAQRAALDARNERDIAIAKERHLLDRIDSYRAALDDLNANDRTSWEAWRTSLLNRWPEGRRPLAEFSTEQAADQGISGRAQGPEAASVQSEPPRVLNTLSKTEHISVFAALEPPPTVAEPKHPVDSVLAWISTDGSARLWAIAVGSAMIFAAMLPPARP